LLSDPGSKTIIAYGLLNKDAKGRTAGIPYPGTLVIDRDGFIRAKLFLDGYQERHTAQDLIKAAKGRAAAPPLEHRSLAAAAGELSLKPELLLSIQHESPTLAFAWSPNGQWLASGTRDGTVHVNAAASGREMHTFATDSPVLSLACSPDSAALALCHDRLGQTFSTWDIETGEQLRSGSFRDFRSEHMAFSPDGTTLVGVSYGEFVHWRLSGPFNCTRAHDHVLVMGGTAALSADGRVSAWAEPDGLVRLREYEPVIHHTTLQVGKVLCIALGPAGKLLAVSRSDHTIQLRDWAGGQTMEQLVGLQQPATRLAFAANGRMLAALGNDRTTIVIWDLDSLHTCHRLQLPSPATALSFAPDGHRLATLGADGKVLIWRTF
jgi:WD40 repeat protein